MRVQWWTEGSGACPDDGNCYADEAMPPELRRLLIVAVVIVAVGASAFIVLESYWARHQPPLKDLPVVLTALRRYSEDKLIRHQPMPAKVSMQDLVQAGYLKPQEAAEFKEVDLTFYPLAAGSGPKTVVARARLADGSQVVLLADGSVETPAK